MKNMKKLFVVLPLVLVMLLSVVPVLAYEAGDPAPAAPFDDPDELNWFADQGDQEFLWRVAERKYNNGILQTVVDQSVFTEADKLHWLHTDAYEMPVWVGENQPWATGGYIAVPDGHTKIVLLNGGGVHGWVTYNPEAAAPLAIAQNYVATSLAEYNIPEYQIMNVLHVQKQVMVPETWLRKSEQPSAVETYLVDPVENEGWDDATYNQNVVWLDTGALMEATAFWNAIGQPTATADATGVMRAQYKGRTYRVFATYMNTETKEEVAKDAALVEIKDEAGKGTGKFQLAEKVVPAIKTLEPIYEFMVGDLVGDEAKKIEWQKPAPAKDVNNWFGKANIETKKVQQNEVSIVSARNNYFTGTLKSKVVNVADPTKLVPAYVHGLMIIVEKSAVPVEITHHFQFADGTEVVEVTNEAWPKAEGELTISKVMTSWYKTVPGFTIDVTKTTVAKVEKDTTLLIGEKVLQSYKVNLYYTAAEDADKDQVDAAFAGNTANVANAQQLPATGAADSFALVLSSLALVVVGLFFKK